MLANCRPGTDCRGYAPLDDACDEVPDLETPDVGDYDDTVLSRIDQLMFDAHTYGIKLIVRESVRCAAHARLNRVDRLA